MADAMEARRVVLLLAPSVAGPVASLWTGHLYNNSPMPKAKLERRASFGGGKGPATRFVTTNTQDALDSVLPTQAEEFVRRKLPPSKFNNPAKLQFRWQ